MGASSILVDPDQLQPLLQSLSGMPNAIERGLQSCEETLAPRLRRLERAAEAAREAVRRAAQASHVEGEGEHEDECRRERERVFEAAREHLERIDRAMEQVRNKLMRYRSAACAAADAKGGHFKRATDELHAIIGRAKAYQHVSLAGPSSAPAPGAAIANGGGTAASVEASLAPLPPGFVWLPLANIDANDFLNDSGEWKKVSKDEMKAGVRRFYAELVPLLNARPHLTRDDLVAVDQARGRVSHDGQVHPESLTNLYDIFLGGGDCMVAERHSDGRYRMSSGRHRASIMRELGHTYAPVKLPYAKPDELNA